MNFPSFAQPVGNPASPFDMLVQAQREKHAREQQALENMFKQQQLGMEWQRAESYRKQTEAQTKATERGEQRDERAFQKQQRMEAAAAIPQISKLLDPNAPDFNPALAQSLGQVHGINFQQKLPQLPPMPGAAPQRPQEGFVGPIDTPEHAAGLAQQQAIQQPAVQGEDPLAAIQGAGDAAANEVIQQQQERDKFSADLQSFDQRQREHGDQLAAYQQAKQQADQNPQYEGTSPLGPISFAPTATQQGMQNRAGGVAGRMRQYAEQLKEQDPARAFRVNQLAGAAEARLLDEKTAMSLLEKELARDTQVDLAGKANQTKLAAAAMRKKGAGSGVKADKLDLDLELKTDSIVQKVLMNTGYKEAAVQNRKFNDMAATIAGAKDNAALSAATAGQWVKQAQGGSGVISDSDMNIFWDRIGGKLSPTQFDQLINNYTSGKLAKGKHAIVSDAIRALANQAQSNLDGIAGQIATRLAPVGAAVPQVTARIPVYQETYIPGYKARKANAAANPPPGKTYKVKNNKTGETKEVSEDEARKLGVIK